MNSDRGERLFLVRMWRRTDDVAGAGWRGSVFEIGTETRFYVSGARDVADFIDMRLSVTTGQTESDAEPGEP